MTPAERHVVEYDPKAAKELSRIDKPVARRILAAVGTLSTEPRPSGARQLVGHPGLWRIRVGSYRVVYAVQDSELIVLALRIGHRSRVYRER